MSRFGASPRHCPPAGGWLGRHAVWGKEGILPPASPRLGRARPTGSANPHPRFHIRVFLKFIYFFLLITAALLRESGRPSGNVRGSNANALYLIKISFALLKISSISSRRIRGINLFLSVSER